MKSSYKVILLYGFLLWFIPFIVAFIVYPTKNFFAPLFETVMGIALTVCAVIFTVLYFRRRQGDYLRQGVVIGLVWFAMSVLIDLPLFLLESPMQMPIANYFMDIGLTYLIFPIVTIGYGWLLAHW
jgi:hypothetical protein